MLAALLILGVFIVQWDFYETRHVVHVDSTVTKIPPTPNSNSTIASEVVPSLPSIAATFYNKKSATTVADYNGKASKNSNDNVLIWTEAFVNSALKEPGGLSKWNGNNVAVGFQEEFNSTIFGSIQDGRLAVQLNETFAFWVYGNVKLCKVLRNITLTKNKLGEESLHQRQQTYFQNASLSLPLVNMTFNCTLLMTKQGLGQGNWITALYAVRMATELARVDFQFQCDDDASHQQNYMLPWFAGSFPYTPATRTNPWPHSGPMPSEGEACVGKYPGLRIDHVLDLIKDDIQKLAVKVVGSSREYHHPDVPIDQKPLIPNVQLDDVAIHFRCGDVFGGAKRNDFGMIAFSAYKKWIHINSTKRVGILTQPFEPHRNRPQDARRAESCKTLVYMLVDYLQEFLQQDTVISIHNGPNETLPLAFARLAMAKQSFTTLSSFGIMPILGTFGQGYFQKGNRGVNPFNVHISKYAGYEHLHMMTAPFKGTWEILKTPINETYWWFTHA